ncbi:hypothetical protein BS50DRAFT_341828 [Corynespora cassiicola Philippines]|uniref:Uncharacterized protein n=1 Tax=Corynespora cassiicola Philippines TaxID=1448308 RepID=A0A2T2NVY0_CORCC|nr:hypothetical protein BS50DRAFT_341828 [Corynespora cassiicola Philippines]
MTPAIYRLLASLQRCHSASRGPRDGSGRTARTARTRPGPGADEARPPHEDEAPGSTQSRPRLERPFPAEAGQKAAGGEPVTAANGCRPPRRVRVSRTEALCRAFLHGGRPGIATGRWRSRCRVPPVVLKRC